MFAGHPIRIALAALVIIVVRGSVSEAECKPDTAANKNRTLFSSLAALHFDESGGSITINGRSTSTFGGEVAIAVCPWPGYSFSIGGESLAEAIETGYIAPGSTNFHPDLSLDFASVALTRRWRNSQIVHPMVSVRVGSVTAEYRYFHRVDGLTETHTDGKSTATFVAPMVGAEVAVFKYMTLYGGAGVRMIGRLQTPELNTNLSGAYAIFGVGFGKFR
jgi:hypothetical protein